MTDPANIGRDEFNDILERCIEAVGSGRATVEQCAARYPDYPELADLLRLTVDFRKLPRPVMPAAFTTKTQQRLQRQFREQLRPARTPTRWNVLGRALAAVLVIAVILVGSGYGLVRASANTVPADFLYKVKQANEGAELFFAGANRPQVLYSIAQARIAEIRTMSDRRLSIASTFLNDAATSVTLARNAQSDGALQDNLSSGLLSAVAYGQSSESIPKEVADPLLARLAMTFGLPQRVTATPTGVVQAQTTTPTPTSTNTPTPQPTLTFSATSTFSATPTSSPASTQATRAPTKRVTAAPSAIPPTASPEPPTATTAPNVAVTVVPTATLGPGPARIMTGIPTEQSTTATEAQTGTQPTSSATASPDVTSTATPTGTLTVEVNDTPTDTLTTTPSVTPTATMTLTLSSTPTASPTRTRTPSRTRRPTRVPTKTRTPTVPSSTPPPTATPTTPPPPAGLPSSDFKQTAQETTFNGCPPQGDGGDGALNQTKNRVDEGNYQQTAFDAVANLSWSKDALGKSRDQWSQAAKDDVGRAEGLPLVVEGYLIKVQENDPEAQNCHSNDFKTWQIWVNGSSGSNNDLSKALVASIGPRIRANHGGWTLDKLNALVGTKIRVSGWLMFNQEHPDDIGKQRLSPWEIHPVMQIAIANGNQWINLDDYHP